MSHEDSNQERSRKSGTDSSIGDATTPSRAPRQDEQEDDRSGDRPAGAYPQADGERQGISNRPAGDEHAFPDPAPASVESDRPDQPQTDPVQQGGSRGGV